MSAFGVIQASHFKGARAVFDPEQTAIAYVRPALLTPMQPSRSHDDFCFHGIGDIAILVRTMMKRIEFVPTWLLAPAEGHIGVQHDLRDVKLAAIVVCHCAHRFIQIAVDDETLFRCKGKEE